VSWDWQGSDDVAGQIEAFLRDGGARPWQRELVVPVLADALTPEPGD
jgi:ribonuclease D